MSALKAIQTGEAPAAIGPYSQAVVHGGLVYTAGQIPLDPGTGELIEGGVKEQTLRVLENLDAVLRAAGSTRSRVIKTTIFLRDLGDFAVVNEVYGRYFGEHRPARSTVQVARLPRDAAVEIEVVAAVDAS